MKAATSMEYPSWGRMLPASVHPLGLGEGTMWEQFGGTKHTGKGSRNHIMLGGHDGPFYYGNLAGIRNVGMAWDRTLIAPTVAGNLTGVEATVGTVRGDIKVEWSASDKTCGLGTEGDDVSLAPAGLNCSGQGVIKAITFANYGTPTGGCGSGFTPGNCSAVDSLDVVKRLCVGKPSCAVNASNSMFGGADPCPGREKTLAIEATCSGYFSLAVALPTGVAEGEVRLPLLGGRSASAVTVKESGTVIWTAGKFTGAAVDGVRVTTQPDPHHTMILKDISDTMLVFSGCSGRRERDVGCCDCCVGLLWLLRVCDGLRVSGSLSTTLLFLQYISCSLECILPLSSLSREACQLAARRLSAGCLSRHLLDGHVRTPRPLICNDENPSDERSRQS